MEFYLILGVPPGGWQMGEWGGGGYGCVGVSHACTHAHTCMHMHVKHDKHAKHGCLHVGSHLKFLYMYTCTCMCMCVYMCMCMGTPFHAPKHPPPICPLPRAAGSPQHQNSSPELIKIIRFCLKILYFQTLLNSHRL